MLPLFFVHVPKTAGTSFRKAAETFFGVEAVAYDYALHAEETSAGVRQWMYVEKDPLGFYQHLAASSTQFLSGHVPAGKYVHLFGVRQTVTFLRDPLQRVVSEYYHFVRHNGYEGDLPSFYRKPQFINRQTKLLQGVPLRAIGFVGLNEVYDASLEMLNYGFGIKLASVEMNMGRADKTLGYELPKAQQEEITALNKEDIRLYRRAKRLLEERKALFDKGLPFVHGEIQQLSDKSLSGWAWHFDNDTAVELEVHLDGECVGHCTAKDLRPGLLRLAPPRNGYAGFHYNFANPLTTGSVVKVVVASSGQCLGEKTVS